jgi:hypothetical protein
MQFNRRFTMRFLIKIGFIVLLVTMAGAVYADKIMTDECKTRYDELNKAQTDVQRDYMEDRKALRTSLGKTDSLYEASSYKDNDERLTDNYNNQVEDIKQEMESLYNDPNCWEWKEE